MTSHIETTDNEMKCSNLLCNVEPDVEVLGEEGWVLCGDCSDSGEVESFGKLIIVNRER